MSEIAELLRKAEMDRRVNSLQMEIFKALAAKVEALEQRHDKRNVQIFELGDRVSEIEDHPALSIPPLPAASGGPQREQGHEAGTCPDCGNPVYHRPGKPGEYDHDCPPPPREADAGQEAEKWWDELKVAAACVYCGVPTRWRCNSVPMHADCDRSKSQPPPPAPAATERQEELTRLVQDMKTVLVSYNYREAYGLVAKAIPFLEQLAAGRESAQPQPALDLGAAFEQWWENEGSKMPEWPPKPHAKQIFKAGAACLVSPWRDASKEKPEEGTPVWIAWNPPRGEKGEAWSRVAVYQKDGHWTSNLGGRINDRDPDYWMPLPPIPNGEAS